MNASPRASRPRMNDNDFAFISTFVEDNAAIIIGAEKRYLVETRLTPLARNEGYETITDMVSALRTGRRRDLGDKVVDAMTTNETSFFRDQHPFDALRDELLPELIKARQAERRLRIWSAACSSGQEAYSLAVLLAENFPSVVADWDVRILCTDISKQMTTRTAAGVFSPQEVRRGIPDDALKRHFVEQGDGFHAKPKLRDLIQTQVMNLAAPHWAMVGGVDVVMLRNVLIYFNQSTKNAILERVHRTVRGDGVLFLGSAESALGAKGFARRVVGRATCYQPETAKRGLIP